MLAYGEPTANATGPKPDEGTEEILLQEWRSHHTRLCGVSGPTTWWGDGGLHEDQQNTLLSGNCGLAELNYLLPREYREQWKEEPLCGLAFRGDSVWEGSPEY